MAQREILAGAVLDVALRAAIFDVLDGTEWRFYGSDEVAANAQRLDFADAVEKRLGSLGGKPLAVTRLERQHALEREIVAFNPDTVEALDLLHAFRRALKDRYGEARTADLMKCLDDVEEALSEVESEYQGPDECDLSRADAMDQAEERAA